MLPMASTSTPPKTDAPLEEPLSSTYGETGSVALNTPFAVIVSSADTKPFTVVDPDIEKEGRITLGVTDAKNTGCSRPDVKWMPVSTLPLTVIPVVIPIEEPE